MSPDFLVSLEPPWNGSHVVRVVGELDLAAAEELRAFLDRLDGNVRIDCTEVSFVDASGIRVLLQAAGHLPSLVLVGVNREVRRVFELTDTTSLLAASPDHATGPEGAKPRKIEISQGGDRPQVIEAQSG
jgi:anti-anti-sigma factor